MKQLLHISFVALLSALMLVQTVGVYITHDICTPCGSEEIFVEMLKATDEELTCDNHKTCHAQEMSCCHQDHEGEKHEHQKEQYFVMTPPAFFNQVNAQEINPELLVTILPILECHIIDIEEPSIYEIKEAPPLPSSLDSYRAILCTYLI